MPASETASKTSWFDLSAMLLLLAGLLLIALSVVWPRVFTGRSGWTDEKALAYQAASAEVHRLSMQAATGAPENQTRAHQEELADAESKYAALRAELDTARGRPARIVAMLRYGGILLLVAGALGLLARRDSPSAGS